jgi:hypothetical protein
MSASVLILGATSMMFQGCVSINFATTQGAGDAFPRANYQILGKTRFDQVWISKTIEAEVVGFGFKRPLARPASFDAKPASHTVVVIPAQPATIVAPSTPQVITIVPKKKHWWQKL